MASLDAVTPRTANVLVECTTQRASFENVMAAAATARCAPPSAAPGCPATPPRPDTSLGYWSDASAASTPCKEEARARSSHRFTHNPYAVSVMGAATSFATASLAPHRTCCSELTTFEMAMTAPHPQPHWAGGAGVPTAAAQRAAPPSNPAMPPRATLATEAAPRATPSRRPAPPGRERNRAAAAAPPGDAAATPTPVAISRVYRNGRPVPVLPDGRPVFASICLDA